MKELLIVSLLWPFLVQAQTNELTPESVLAFERARFEATRTSDVGKLRDMLADDLTWVHSSGKRQNKAQYIHDLETSKTSYKSITVEEASARLFGPVAVTTGRARYDAVSNGQPMLIRAYHTAVYQFQAGRWQVVAWQATRIDPTEP